MAEPRKAPEAPVRPDEAMETLLKEVYASFDPEIGYVVDEVSVTVPRERIAEACRLAKDEPRLKMDYLRCLAVTEYPDYFQAVYLLWSTSLSKKYALKANAPKDDPALPSVTGVWRGADWHEREGAELFGLRFEGHPKLEHLLLFDEFEGKYPMRKDYPFEETEEWSEEASPRWELDESGRPARVDTSAMSPSDGN